MWQKDKAFSSKKGLSRAVSIDPITNPLHIDTEACSYTREILTPPQ